MINYNKQKTILISNLFIQYCSRLLLAFLLSQKQENMLLINQIAISALFPSYFKMIPYATQWQFNVPNVPLRPACVSIIDIYWQKLLIYGHTPRVQTVIMPIRNYYSYTYNVNNYCKYVRQIIASCRTSHCSQVCDDCTSLKDTCIFALVFVVLLTWKLKNKVFVTWSLKWMYIGGPPASCSYFHLASRPQSEKGIRVFVSV